VLGAVAGPTRIDGGPGAAPGPKPRQPTGTRKPRVFGDGYSAHGRVGTARRQGPDRPATAGRRPATAGRRPAARVVRALGDGDEENARRGLTSNLIDGGGRRC